MTSTFYLKEPNSKKESLIYFSCYFKEEGKKFVYSTGETILPSNWDQKSRIPNSKGKNKASNRGVIQGQLNRYSDFFNEVRDRCITMQVTFTSRLLKKEFDDKFKKTPGGKNIFYDAYDEFTAQKTKNQEWKPSTVKRYKNIKNILMEFEKERKFNLSFNAINSRFHAEFTDYCMVDKKHVNNTYSRNLGLFKTFMLWAFKNGYTYNQEFKEMQKVPKVIIPQVALQKADLEQLMQKDFENVRLERVRDVFVFACVTGLRFGELSFVSKNSVIGDVLHLKEEKGAEKEVRTIPLNDLALYLLRKYDYKLPLIANQKQNLYIKEVIDEAGFKHTVEKVIIRGKEVQRIPVLFKDMVSTHTARRTFITMLKRDGKSDKLISKITGHRDLKTLNQYYQVDDDSKKEAIAETFKMNFQTVKKA
jgi:integrase